MTFETEASIDYDEDGRAIAEAAEEFVRREIVPDLAAWRAASTVPRGLFESAGHTGLVGLFAPTEVGGLGVTDLRFADVTTHALVASGAFGLAWAMGLHASVAIPILARPRPDGLDSSMADHASGAAILAVAGLDGDVRISDSGVLSGVSHGVASSSVADVFVVLAQSETGSQRVVRVDRTSVKVKDDVRHLGAGDANARSVTFDAVPVRAENILPEEAADDLLTRVALLVGAVAVSATRFCIERTVEYVNERQVFGRPVAMFDNTRERVAATYAGLRAASGLYRAVLANGIESEAGRIDALSLAAHSVHIFSGAADLGVQMHGGYGYMTEYPISHAFAAARFLELIVRGLPTAQERIARAAGLAAAPSALESPRPAR